MAIEFSIKIERDLENEAIFVASSQDATGTDCIIAGYGDTPYAALHDFISELEVAELYQPESA